MKRKEQVTILSLMLDDVSGTDEIVTIRQDACRVKDCIMSCVQNMGLYYTGNKAEGLDLPGSDHEFRFDINNVYNIPVV